MFFWMHLCQKMSDQIFAFFVQLAEDEKQQNECDCRKMRRETKKKHKKAQTYAGKFKVFSSH